ncbi:transcriptional regulator [Mycobacterium asiaticum]|uniref:Transcriptional regulator n=1 Tax=Mycobacterium asiaticum TaxID=1790 RepID=A0A1A3NIP1_MYCAS|nr:HTH domain-containing protein [Mycobacterium asiaticum]OBK20914.1 transcriptional regulator [Mycobacterium asiaticum]
MNEETDTEAGRPKRNRLPRNRRRERILQMVREQDEAVDAVEIAAQIGLHVTTVRFHLDALCDEGMIVRSRLNLPGAGRPRTGYRAVEERLDYRILAEVLAMELGRTAEMRARRAQHAGQKWAARLVGSQNAQPDRTEATADKEADHALDLVTLRVNDVFQRMGFDSEVATSAEPTAHTSPGGGPTPASERMIRLHACPVRDLARAHPDVGCALHLGLLQGLLANSGAGQGGREVSRGEISGHLDPLVEPELCVARLVARV